MIRKVALAIASLMALVICFETYAVLRAKRETPALLAGLPKGELQLADLTPSRRAMLLRVEDPGFATHHGVDYSTPGQGRTTLTQGLVKILYFKNFQPGFAKIEQSLIARFVLDPAMSKGRQLETYLNMVRLGTAHGRQVIGYGEASRVYFGRRFTALDDHQFLSLVAMTIAPNMLDPLRHQAANAERVRRIELLLAGRCTPDGVGDNSYASCARPAPRI